ncbi:hypothetical protein JXM67_10420 [candidate division WOR-3 bacterium]|nr:hypothetical protein [candidate division WOR-3 bacterium]
MAFFLLNLLFGQYAGVYVPHSPLHVEQGSVISSTSADLELTYRTATNTVFGSPAMSGFGFSPDGYNEIGMNLPWLKVAADTSWPVYVGNLGVYYKRYIMGSLRYGYLAARAFADVSTARDTFGVKDSLGRRTLYGLGFSYTYELPLLKEYHDLFGKLPVVGSVSVEDAFLTRDHQDKEWLTDFGSGFGWGVSLEMLPLDYVFVGAAVKGEYGLDPGVPEGTYLIPYIGLYWYWCDLGVSYRMGEGENRIEFGLRIFL